MPPKKAFKDQKKGHKGQKDQKGQTGQKGQPNFDAAALSKLTAKIDSSLPKPQEHRPEKRKRTDGEAKEAKPSKRPAHEPRDRRPNDRFNNSNSNSNSKFQKGKREDKKPEAFSLIEEIKALGGDEADLELIAGIDSDAEDGQPPATGKASAEVGKDLLRELSKLASNLGFDKVRDEAIAADDEIEEEAEVEEDGVADEDGWEEEEEEEEEEAAAPLRAPQPSEKEKPRKGASNLIFEPRPDWHGAGSEGLPAPVAGDIRNFASTISSLKTYAKTLWDGDAAAYESTVAKSSTRKFMSTIMSSGTMSDKVSALTLAIQESPVHNIKPLENLISLAGKKSRGPAITALAALVDLLGNGVVLPSDRRLRPFHTQPGLIGTLQTRSASFWRPGQALPGQITKAHLIMWIFEDWLKETYFKIIQLLEVWCGDEIEYSRTRSLDFVFGLLRDKPEQEANLLRLLVNKLGDRERKIASRASYLLLQLLNIHPGMKPIVVNTMEQEILLRSGQTIRTKYYAINTLNQTILNSKEPAVADTLIRIYFELFVLLLKSGALGSVEQSAPKKGGDRKYDRRKPKHEKQAGPKDAKAIDSETAEKLVSAILTGVNRAVPFGTADESTLEKHLDTLFRITHSSNFNTSIQALMLIQQLSSTRHIAVDRFYRTLYESLLDPRLITSSKQALYLNLLFRSLKNDVDVRRVKAFVKRMLQAAHLHQPSFTCGILFLVAELEGTFPDIKTLLNEPEAHEDDQEEVYKDVAEGEPSGEAEAEQPRTSTSAYDGRKRDPQYSNADQSCLWELVPYLGHFHPAVAVFAANILARQKSLPKPELANHTLMHFLDKFVYRNPKAADGKRGTSIMQPVLAAGSADKAVVPGKTGVKQQPSVNSASFWNLRKEDVAAEDVFFHEYFSQSNKPELAARAAAKAKKKSDAEDDEEGAEEEIWDALVNSRPEIEGDDADADADMDMDSDGGSELAELLGDMSDSDEDGDEDMDGEDDEADDEEGGAWVDGADLVEGSGEAARFKKDKMGRMDRKEFKSLPMFASADDYAAMLAEEDDGIGN